MNTLIGNNNLLGTLWRWKCSIRPSLALEAGPKIGSPRESTVGWDYDAWAWYDVGHDADRRERRDRRDRGNLYLYI